MKSSAMGLFLAAAILMWPTPAWPQTSYPMVMSCHPVAVPVGQTTEITLNGRYNFYGAYRILFAGEGVSAEIVPPEVKTDPKKPDQKPSVSSLKLKITVAEDAPLGVRDFRVATPQGVSSTGQLIVVDGPVTVESDDNNTPEKAHELDLPAHVCGRIEKTEDVDYFKFHAEAGDEVTFEVVCQRIQDRIHDLQKHADPIITLSDPSGRKLAASDNYFFADPVLHHRFEQAGDYLLELRDVRYAGDSRWSYVLGTTEGPYVLNLLPAAVSPGKSVELSTVGFNLGELASTTLTVPNDWEPGQRDIRLDSPAGKTNPVPVVVSDLPTVQVDGQNTSQGSAVPISVPAGVSGRLAAENDAHWFSLEAKKGQAINIEVTARRLFSSLDSYVEVLNAEGKSLANNDDAEGKDSRLDWTAPADGTFYLRLRDLHFRGGETFVYFLAVQPAEPDFLLQCDSDKALIGPGTSTTWYVHIQRRNGFSGPVELQVEGLPEGVDAACGTIAPAMKQAAIVLTAAWDAPVGVSNVRVIGTGPVKADDGSQMRLQRVAQPMQEIYVPGGGRALYPVRLHTVSVTERSDLVTVVPSRRMIRLKPGQSARIDLNIKRHPRYTKPITLDVRLQHLGRVYGDPLPPGVTVDESASKTLLGEGETRGHVVLKATDDAKPIQDVPISVLANVSINFVVKISYSTPPILLSIEPGDS